MQTKLLDPVREKSIDDLECKIRDLSNLGLMERISTRMDLIEDALGIWVNELRKQKAKQQ